MDTELEPEAIILNKIKDIVIPRSTRRKIQTFIKLCLLRRERNILLGESITKDLSAMGKAIHDLENWHKWSSDEIKEIDDKYYQRIYQSRRNLIKNLD